MADNVTSAIGTRGTDVGAGETVCFTNTLWNLYLDSTYTLDQLMGTNGEAIAAETARGSTTDLGGGFWNYETSLADGFADVLVGMYLNNLTGTANFLAGMYEITAITDTTNITIKDTSLTGSTIVGTDTLLDYSIAGLMLATIGTELQDALDAIANDIDGTVNNVDVLDNESSITISATITADSFTGDSGNRARVIGTNGSFVIDGTQPIITTSTVLANGLIEYPTTNPSNYLTWINFDFNGNSNAANCIRNNNDNAKNNSFINCRMRGATSHAVIWGGTQFSSRWSFVGCEVDNNAGGGLEGRSGARGPASIAGCYIHDNIGGDGIFVGIQSSIVNNIIDTSGGHGISLETGADHSVISGNTIYNSTLDGMDIPSGADAVEIYNNTSNDNGGYGYDLHTNPSAMQSFCCNHAEGNTGNGSTITHCTEVLDILWTNFFEGNNIAGLPLFTNAAGGDFTLQSASPLREAGVGGTDIGALQFNGTGGGGVANLLEGLIT